MGEFKLLTDQLDRTVKLPVVPERIVSCVPSITELLFYLGAGARVVGATDYCVRPLGKMSHVTRIGGTKSINLDTVHALKPDLVIANKEENLNKKVTTLWEAYPTWVSDVPNVESALEMIDQLGQVLGLPKQAERLSRQLEVQLGILSTEQFRPVRTGYFIWKQPYMVAASETFISHMMDIGGFDNCFSHLTRYPRLTVEDIRNARPEAILLSSEPFEFRREHLAEFQEIVPQAKVFLVDGRLFSWYGSSMLEAPHYFRQLRAQLGHR